MSAGEDVWRILVCLLNLHNIKSRRSRRKGRRKETIVVRRLSACLGEDGRREKSSRSANSCYRKKKSEGCTYRHGGEQEREKETATEMPFVFLTPPWRNRRLFVLLVLAEKGRRRRKRNHANPPPCLPRDGELHFHTRVYMQVSLGPCMGRNSSTTAVTCMPLNAQDAPVLSSLSPSSLVFSSSSSSSQSTPLMLRIFANERKTTTENSRTEITGPRHKETILSFFLLFQIRSSRKLGSLEQRESPRERRKKERTCERDVANSKSEKCLVHVKNPW